MAYTQHDPQTFQQSVCSNVNLGWFLSGGAEKILSNGADALRYDDVGTSSVTVLTCPFLETRGEKLMACPCHRTCLGIKSAANVSL